MYNSINRKQFEYLQAMTQIQEDLLGACNGLIKNQVDLIEEYSKKGIVTREQTMPIVELINEYIEAAGVHARIRVQELYHESYLIVSAAGLVCSTLSQPTNFLMRLIRLLQSDTTPSNTSRVSGIKAKSGLESQCHTSLSR